MKKTLSFLIALTMCMAFTGCKKSSDNTPKDTTPAATTAEEKIEFDVKAAYEANLLSNLLKTSESVKESYEYGGEMSYSEYFLDSNGNIAFINYMDDDNVISGNYNDFSFDAILDENILHLSTYITEEEKTGFADFSLAYFLDEYKIIDAKLNGDLIEVEMKISEIFECEPIFVKFEKDTLRLRSFDDGTVMTYEYGEFGKKDFIKNTFESEKITVTFNVETYAENSKTVSDYTIEIPKGSVLCPYEVYEGYFAYSDAEYTKSIGIDYYAAPFTDGMTIYLTNAAG